MRGHQEDMGWKRYSRFERQVRVLRGYDFSGSDWPSEGPLAPWDHRAIANAFERQELHVYRGLLVDLHDHAATLQVRDRQKRSKE